MARQGSAVRAANSMKSSEQLRGESMEGRAFVRALMALLLVTALAGGSVSADSIAGAGILRGVGQSVEVQFGDINGLLARTYAAEGVYVGIMPAPPFLDSGPTGRGGAEGSYNRYDPATGFSALVCALGDSQWTLTVEPQAESATLVSTLPGCHGTVQFEGYGNPGITVAPSAGTLPGPDGATASTAITVTRWATATGSFAGDAVTDVHWAKISYTYVVETG